MSVDRVKVVKLNDSNQSIKSAKFTLEKIKTLEELRAKIDRAKWMDGKDYYFCEKDDQDFCEILQMDEPETSVKPELYVKVVSNETKENGKKEIENNEKSDSLLKKSTQMLKEVQIEATLGKKAELLEVPNITNPFSNIKTKEGTPTDPSKLTPEERKELININKLTRGFTVNENGDFLSSNYNAFELINKIPPFSICDSSSVEVYISYDKRVSTLVKNGAWGVSGGVGCPFFSVSSSFKNENKHATTNSNTEIYINGFITYPRVTLNFEDIEETLIRPSPIFVEAVDKALNHPQSSPSRLIEVFKHYGNFYSTQVTLGGQYKSSDKKTINNKAAEDEVKRTYKKSLMSYKLLNKPIGEGDAALVNANQNSDQSVNFKQEIIHDIHGGNTLTNDVGAWTASLCDHSSWRVIHREIKPIYHLLDTKRQKKINQLIRTPVYYDISLSDCYTCSFYLFDVVSIGKTPIFSHSTPSFHLSLVQTKDSKNLGNVLTTQIEGTIPLYEVFSSLNHLNSSCKVLRALHKINFEEFKDKKCYVYPTMKRIFEGVTGSTWHGIGDDVYTLTTSNTAVKFDEEDNPIQLSDDCIQLAATTKDPSDYQKITKFTNITTQSLVFKLVMNLKLKN